MTAFLVRVVLDASAITAFCRESVDVGEIICEIADENTERPLDDIPVVFGLPILCLIEATRTVADTDRLDLLVNHPAAAVLSPDPDNWRALATAYDTVGRLDAASALLDALDSGCHVVTGQPALYAGIAGGGPIIRI